MIAGALVVLTLVATPGGCGPKEPPGPTPKPGESAGPAVLPPDALDDLVKPGPGDHILAVTIRAFKPKTGGLGDMLEARVNIIVSVTARNGKDVPLLAGDGRALLDWSRREQTPIKFILSQPPTSQDHTIKADLWIRSSDHPDTIFKCYWEVDGVPVLTQVTGRLGSFEGKGAPCRHQIIFT